jgi:CheY-like chemotaxis protein
VLVVETSTDAVDWIRTTLSNLEYKVIIARSGTEALEKARFLQPCLILLSPDLPMLSGWDVLALLKGDAVTQHIRVVMMKHADEPKINSHHADGILIRPIKAEELRAFLPHDAMAPKTLKFLHLNQNIEDTVINLLQSLGHCLIEADDLNQCDVLSKIWQPDLFLIDGDNKFLLTHLEYINQLNMLSDLPILIITRSDIVEIDWLNKRFKRLNLHDCVGLDLEHVETHRAEILLALNQSINKALCYQTSHTLTSAANFESDRR